MDIRFFKIGLLWKLCRLWHNSNNRRVTPLGSGMKSVNLYDFLDRPS